MVAPVAVLLNLIFGLAAAWAIARFQLSRPRAADRADRSAVHGVAGGRRPLPRAALRPAGLLGPWLREHDIKVIFACAGPGARDLLRHVPGGRARADPAHGGDGLRRGGGGGEPGRAAGGSLFWLVTLPNVKWGLLYGIILCNARAMGEFGAVVGGVGPHRRRDRHHAAPHREAIPGVQPARRVRGRVGARPCWRWSRSSSRSRSSGAPAASSKRRKRLRSAGKEVPHEHHGEEHHQAFGSFVALDNVSLEVPGGELVAAARAFGLRQDDAAAHHRRPRGAGRGHGALPRRGRHRVARARAQRRLRVPALRAVPPHDRVREHRVRPARAALRPRTRSTTASTSSCGWCSSRASGDPSRRSSPADSASAWRWPARWRRSPRCCCSTSPSARSTPRCARSCGSGCAGCTTRSTSRACSSRTTRRKRSRSPTASSS